MQKEDLPDRVKPLTAMFLCRYNSHVFTATLNVLGHESTIAREAVAWTVAGYPGITLGTMAEATGLSPRTIADSISHFIKEGVVRQEIDPSDRRLRRLYLTELGESQLERLLKHVEKVRERLLVLEAFVDEQEEEGSN